MISPKFTDGEACALLETLSYIVTEGERKLAVYDGSERAFGLDLVSAVLKLYEAAVPEERLSLGGWFARIEQLRSDEAA